MTLTTQLISHFDQEASEILDTINMIMMIIFLNILMITNTMTQAHNPAMASSGPFYGLDK